MKNEGKSGREGSSVLHVDVGQLCEVRWGKKQVTEGLECSGIDKQLSAVPCAFKDGMRGESFC